MDLIAEYYQVLQEESERVCGRALPTEIIHLILFRWGGLEHPAATLIRGVMSRPHDIGPWRVWAVPYGTIPRHVFGDVPSAEKMADPSTEFAAYITDCTLRLSDISGDGSRGRHELPDGKVFVYGLSWRLQLALNRDVRGEGVWWAGCGGPMIHWGMRLTELGLWLTAARCRGLPDHVVNAFQRGPDPRATKPELCGLLYRAETDRSWRFWYDLVMAHPEGTTGYGAGFALGVGMGLGALGFGSYGVRKMMPLMSPLESFAAFTLTTRTVARTGWYAWNCAIMGRPWTHSNLQ